MTMHSRILARRTPRTEDPSRLQSTRLQSDMTEHTHSHDPGFFNCVFVEKEKMEILMFYKMCHVRWANLRSRETQKRDTQSSFIAYQKLSSAHVGFW